MGAYLHVIHEAREGGRNGQTNRMGEGEREGRKREGEIEIFSAITRSDSGRGNKGAGF